MKGSCPKIRKCDVISIRAWLVIFLAALALHLLLFSLFRPLRENVAESSSNDRYVLFFTEKELAGKRSDPHRIRYWLRYMDPERILKSDPVSGFSMFSGKAEVSAPDPVQFHHAMFKPSPLFHFQPEQFTSERTVSDFAGGAGIPVMTRPRVPETRTAAVRYPVWTDESGKTVTGLFHRDRSSLQLLEKQRPAKPTLLRLTLRQGSFPDVEVLRSCGNLKLDMLAVRQLKVRQENFEPGASPLVKYYTVSWQAPDRKSILEEKQP